MRRHNIVALFLWMLLGFNFLCGYQASAGEKDFLFGIETHFRRLWWEDGAFGVVSEQNTKENYQENYQIFMDLIDELGVNMIRDGHRFIDLMPDKGDHKSLDATNMGYMTQLLGDLKSRDITLDWVILDAPKWARNKSLDENGEYKYGNGYFTPPIAAYWEDFLKKTAQESEEYDANIIMELWNEPDLNEADIGKKQFWSGTTSDYLDILSAGALSIKDVSSSFRVINGGLTIDTKNSDFYDAFKPMLEDGTIDYVAIHSHGDIDTLHSKYKLNVPSSEIEPGKILLNESGDYATELEQAEQAKNTAGKAIYALANGFRGYSLYYLGGVNSTKNDDLNESAKAGSYYFMLDDNLEKRQSFYAYKTVIEMLRGAVIKEKIHEDIGRYEYLFSKPQTGEEIYVAIGGDPDLEKIKSSLGGRDYERYDMLGDLGNSAKDIQYFVT
ncbi:MAG: cellulase family glycosylhydrolase, partial [Synergistaceae bacterium]|nr:cellulase family glycosylhydrolase [Synergistaceae bacterium]